VKIERKFTVEGKGPYEGIEWTSRTSEIRNTDGKAVFFMEGVVVPSSWSQIATDIIAQKYFRKAGIPAEKAGAWNSFVPESQRSLWKKGKADHGETDARQVFHRLAFTWTQWGKGAGYFDSEADEPSTTRPSTCSLVRSPPRTALSGSTPASMRSTGSRARRRDTITSTLRRAR
jgi:ribonucleoside-diphosphate reductase alpha chain